MPMLNATDDTVLTMSSGATTTMMTPTSSSLSLTSSTSSSSSLSSLVNRSFVNAFLWARGSVRWALFLVLSNWTVVHVLVLRVWHFDGTPRTADSQLSFVDSLCALLGVASERRASVGSVVFWSFHACEAVLAYVWLWCVFSDPGVLHKPLVRQSHNSDVDECAQCGASRPAVLRAHHCRQCRRCVERMDHCCVWIGQDVGARNHKTFIIYVALSLALLLLDSIVLWTRLAEISTDALLFRPLTGSVALQGVAVLLFAALYSACAYSVLTLFLLQCELIYRGETTVEWLRRVRANKERAVSVGAPPNDWRNVRRFFGENWFELLNIHRAVPPI
jgi:hypothetical protein